MIPQIGPSILVLPELQERLPEYHSKGPEMAMLLADKAFSQT
jgi:hypothetical protein